MKVVVFDRMEECTETEVNRMLPLVSDQRREQALRYKHTMGQFCCLKSWVLLRDILKTPTKPRQNPDKTPIEWQKMEYNEQGKPFLPNGPFFSISHCKAGIAVAVDEQPIGIDIESIRHADEELIERTMNEEEEAVVKAEGTGICSFEQLQTLLPANKTYRLETIEKEKYIYTIAYKN